MTEYWPDLKHLFDTDDGSLPDVFVTEISGAEVCAIYNWVMSLCEIYGEPTLWFDAQGKDVPIRDVPDPAGSVVAGDVIQFRHGLSGLCFGGVELPTLTIAVCPEDIEFDYRMGSEWGAQQLGAFLGFLAGVLELAPGAKVVHRFEGVQQDTPGFTEAVGRYV